MSTWNPPQPEKPVRRSTSVASPAASLLRLTVLSLATSGPVFIAPTLDALVPHGAKFTLAGKSGVSRATIADAFEAIYDESKGVVFHELREVDAMLVCSKPTPASAGATALVTSAGTNSTVSVCFESGNKGLALVDLSLSTEQPWLKEQN